MERRNFQVRVEPKSFGTSSYEIYDPLGRIYRSKYASGKNLTSLEAREILECFKVTLNLGRISKQRDPCLDIEYTTRSSPREGTRLDILVRNAEILNSFIFDKKVFSGQLSFSGAGIYDPCILLHHGDSHNSLVLYLRNPLLERLSDLIWADPRYLVKLALTTLRSRK